MATKKIPPQKFDILLAFLPAFEKSDRVFQIGQNGRRRQYPDDVQAFFRWANDPVWMDLGYDPAKASKLIVDDAYIAEASLTQLRPLLTFCVRGERMHDGHWAAMLETGRVQAILRRLQQLHPQPQAA